MVVEDDLEGILQCNEAFLGRNGATYSELVSARRIRWSEWEVEMGNSFSVSS